MINRRVECSHSVADGRAFVKMCSTHRTIIIRGGISSGHVEAQDTLINPTNRSLAGPQDVAFASQRPAARSRQHLPGPIGYLSKIA